jgi:hypothetical protein
MLKNEGWKDWRALSHLQPSNVLDRRLRQLQLVGSPAGGRDMTDVADVPERGRCGRSRAEQLCKMCAPGGPLARPWLGCQRCGKLITAALPRHSARLRNACPAR